MSKMKQWLLDIMKQLHIRAHGGCDSMNKFCKTLNLNNFQQEEVIKSISFSMGVIAISNRNGRSQFSLRILSLISWPEISGRSCIQESLASTIYSVFDEQKKNTKLGGKVWMSTWEELVLEWIFLNKLHRILMKAR